MFVAVSVFAALQVAWRYLGTSLTPSERQTLYISIPIFLVAGVMPLLPKLRSPDQVANSIGIPTIILATEAAKLFIVVVGSFAWTTLSRAWKGKEGANNDKLEQVLQSSKELEEVIEDHVAIFVVSIFVVSLSRTLIRLLLLTLLLYNIVPLPSLPFTRSSKAWHALH
jgi:hypothetical protein